MPTKLKGLKITSTDLVDQGANPDAYIRLYKRKGDDDKETLPEKETFFHKFATAMENALRQCAPNDVKKKTETFSDKLYAEQVRDLTYETYGYCDALSDSLRSIISDSEKTSEEKLALMNKSIDQFSAAIKAAAPLWANGKSANTANTVTKTNPEPESNTSDPNGVTISTTDSTVGKTKEETDMKFDKSKMTPEEIQTLESLEKRYGIADEPTPAANATEGVEKNAEPLAAAATPAAPAPETDGLHPDVKKALDEFETVKKAQLEEIEGLKKSLEIERLTTFAKKYEIIGKNADELAAKLYELKKAGGTVYADYVALLDENLTAVEKGGLFSAIGSDNSGTTDTVGKIRAAAGEIAKAANTGMTPEAIVKAWENNPELAEMYESEYRNGGK